MTYTIYKSSDPDAPQLTVTVGALKTVLKACLITGYGTGADEKPAAGWLMPFEETNKAVFQPVDAGGENWLIRMDNSSYSVNWALYETMSDINTGTHQVSGYRPVLMGDKWFVVATPSWFWVFARYTSSPTWACCFGGNIPKILAENDSKTVIGGMNSNINFVYNTAFKSSAGVVNMFKPNVLSNGHLTAAADELIWLDVLLADNERVLGKLPLLKWCPKNNGFDTWHEVATNAYVVQIKNGSNKTQLVMDFNDVS